MTGRLKKEIIHGLGICLAGGDGIAGGWLIMDCDASSARDGSGIENQRQVPTAKHRRAGVETDSLEGGG